MSMPLGKLKVTISSTADGQHSYMQIMSEDSLSVNVVLIADEIEVEIIPAPSIVQSAKG